MRFKRLQEFAKRIIRRTFPSIPVVKGGRVFVNGATHEHHMELFRIIPMVGWEREIHGCTKEGCGRREYLDHKDHRARSEEAAVA